MNVMVRCPCCNQPWRAAPQDRLPPFLVKPLAFEFIKRETRLLEPALRNGKKFARLTRGRAMFVWICRTYGTSDVTYPRIARWLDKNHASVFHLWTNVVPRLRANDPDFVASCDRFAAFAANPPEIQTCQ